MRQDELSMGMFGKPFDALDREERSAVRQHPLWIPYMYGTAPENFWQAVRSEAVRTYDVDHWTCFECARRSPKSSQQCVHCQEEDDVIRARSYAIDAHGDQKYSGSPYVYHLDQVAAVLMEFGYMSVPLLQAAYLHDVIEDTDRGPWDIHNEFGADVMALVLWVTDPQGISRRERKALMYSKLRGTPAVPVKLADRIANVYNALRVGRTRFLHMYQDEQWEFERDVRVPGEHEELWNALRKALGYR